MMRGSSGRKEASPAHCRSATMVHVPPQCDSASPRNDPAQSEVALSVTARHIATLMSNLWESFKGVDTLWVARELSKVLQSQVLT